MVRPVDSIWNDSRLVSSQSVVRFHPKRFSERLPRPGRANPIGNSVRDDPEIWEF